jgi:Zn-dependent M28 family amino/carboxypeptidase
VQVKAEVAQRWLKLAGHSLEEVVKAIDTDLRPRSFALPVTLSVKMSVDLLRETRPVSNVLGYLAGETDEYVIIGAHYDHIGLGEQFSMQPAKRGTVHPGADDNASGTAGVIELARWFAKHPRRRRGILFIAFAGEEFGLLGSNHYVDAPELPLEKTVTMINLDMIGRLRDDKLYIGGIASGSGFQTLIDELARDAKFSVDDADADGYGSSDQYSFTPQQIPTLFFFTGLHRDYHRPTDTWDKIDAPASARLLDFIGQAAERLLDAPERPQFLKRPR